MLDRLALALFARLTGLVGLWLSLLPSLVAIVVVDLQTRAEYSARYQGTCSEMFVGTFRCSHEQFMEGFWDGMMLARRASEIAVWVAPVALAIVLLWGLVGSVVFVLVRRRDKHPGEAGWWLAGALVQGLLNALTFLGSWAVFAEGSWWISLGGCAVLVGALQIIWLLPLLTGALMVQPRVAPGLLATASLSALLAVPCVIAYLSPIL